MKKILVRFSIRLINTHTTVYQINRFLNASSLNFCSSQDSKFWNKDSFHVIILNRLLGSLPMNIPGS